MAGGGLLGSRVVLGAAGPGLPNLSYPPGEVFRAIARIDDEQGAPRQHGRVSMHNGYLAIVFSERGPSRGGFAFYDISNPYSPRLVNRRDDAATFDIREPHGYGTALYAGRELVALQAARGVQIWDWTDVMQPKRLSYLILPGVEDSAYVLGAWWVSFPAPYLYVGGGANGIYVVDATDPAHPVLVDRGEGRPNPIPVVETGGFRIGALYAVGNRLFASSNEASGYVVLDISDPRHPAVLAVEPAGPFLYSFLVNGGRLLGAGSDGFLHVHDVDAAGLVRPRSRINLHDRVGYLAFQDGFVHAGASSRYVKVDLRNPSAPVVAGSGSSGLEDRDEDFGTPLGNLAVVTDDHGYGTHLIPHQADPDTLGPAVNMVVPAPGAGGQLLSTRVGLTFTDQVDLRSVNASTLVVRPAGGAALAGRYSTELGIVNFAPDQPLLPDRVYEVVVPPGGIRDLAGNPVATPFLSRFDTGPSEGSPLSCRVVAGAPVPVGVAAQLRAQAAGSVAAPNYSWDFGDGSPATAFTASPESIHAFTTPGHRAVTATVSDGVYWARCAGMQTAHNPLTAGPPAASGSILVDEERGLVWTVNPDQASVSAIDRDSYDLRIERPVGREPRSLARAPDGTIWVVSRRDPAVTVLDPGSGSIIATTPLPLGSKPYGIVFSPDGAAAYVSLEATGRLLKLDPRSREIVQSLDLGPSPRGIAVASDSARLLVTRFVSPRAWGEVYDVAATPLARTRVIWLAASGPPDTEVSGRGVPNYLVSVAISPDGRQALVPSKKDNTGRGLRRDGHPLTFESTVRTIVSAIDLRTQREDPRARRDLNDRDLAIAAAFSPLGDYVFVAVQGSNRVDVLDAYSGGLVTSLEDVGRAPQGLALSEDGRLFVSSLLSREIVVHDVGELLTSTGVRAPRLARAPTVTEETLPAAVLEGKRLFYNAQDLRINRDGYLSCASCHLDGGQDGRVWDFSDRGEGLRNTIGLEGCCGLGHGPLHWTANFDEVQDFEQDIRAHFGGKGFLSDEAFLAGTRREPLGDAKAGLSPELDALAAYLASLQESPMSPYRNPDGSLTPEGEAGRVLFQQLGCPSCHAGTRLTDSGSGMVHDVGTLKATSGRRLGKRLEGLDTPTLKGLWESAPYLHDGSASTLPAVLTSANSKRRHGAFRSLTPDQVSDLAAYLLQIDDREPAPPAQGVGVRITAPAVGATLPRGVAVWIDVEAVAGAGSLRRTEVRVDGVLVGSDPVSPYAVVWRPTRPGRFGLAATALHGNGARTRSELVFVTVE